MTTLVYISPALALLCGVALVAISGFVLMCKVAVTPVSSLQQWRNLREYQRGRKHASLRVPLQGL